MRLRTSILMRGTIAAALGALAVLPSHADEVTLRGASCFPIGSPPSASFEKVVETINERGKGIVQIDLVGGAPAIGSPFTLTQRMALGTYDIAGCPESFFGNIIPEAPVLRLQEYSFAELRKNGGIDYFQKLANEKGIFYVGRHHDDGQFHIYLTEPISGPDLTGLNIRVSPVYTEFLTAMGASVQRTDMSEIYTLMENGNVDGFGWPLRAFSPSWYEVTKYRVDPGIYHASIHVVANLKKWESLSPEARDVIESVVIEAENQAEGDSEASLKLDEEMRKEQAENGIEAITLEGDDAENWVKTAQDVAWKDLLETSPEHGAKLKELFTKPN